MATPEQGDAAAEWQTATITFNLDHLIIVRSGLKLLLQQTPRQTREPVAQLLAGIEIHVAVLSKVKDV